MDAVNAVIHLIAAIAFLALGLWSLSHQRRSRRLVQMVNWQSGARPLPRRSFGRLPDYLADLCLTRNIACDIKAASGFPAGFFELEPWILALTHDRVKAIRIDFRLDQWRVVVQLVNNVAIDGEVRKSLASSVTQLKMVIIEFSSGAFE